MCDLIITEGDQIMVGTDETFECDTVKEWIIMAYLKRHELIKLRNFNYLRKDDK